MITAHTHTDLVIFDLWKTLVPLTHEVKRRAFFEPAIALKVDAEELAPVWAGTRVQRETGDLRRYLTGLGSLLGREWTDDDVTMAMAARRRNHITGFRDPLPDAEDCLRALQDSGTKIGVVSNGSSDVVEMLNSSRLAPYVDVAVVSGVFGAMKPDPTIYEAVSRRLGISLNRSIYVGDGQDFELEGAERAGCRSVLIERGSLTEWAGESIESLESVPLLLGAEPITKEMR